MNQQLTRPAAARMVAWNMVENGGLAVVSFVSLIVYSRYLSPSDFGLFSIVLALVDLLGLLVNMLFHDVLVQRAEVSPSHFDTAFTFTLVLSLVLLAGCALFAPTFARYVGNPVAGSVLTWTALCLPCAAIGSTIVPLQRRKLEFRPLALRSLVGRLGGAVLGILLVIAGARFWGLVAQHVLFSLVGSLVLWIAATDRPRLRFQLTELRSLLGFSLYSVSGLFLSIAINRLFIIVVGVTLGADAAGYLNLSFRVVEIPWAIAATGLVQTGLPVLSRLTSDQERLTRAYGSALALASLTLYACFVGIAVTAPEIVELLFGRTWLPCSPYITALALLVFPRVPKQLGRSMFAAIGRPSYSLMSAGVEMMVMIGLLAAFGARSLPWAILIWAIREFVTVPVTAFLLKRGGGIRYMDQMRGTLPALIASAVMCGVVYAARWTMPRDTAAALRLAIFIPVGAAAFLLTAWLVDRGSVASVIDFVGSAARRQKRRPPS